jgi:hypothetical protein
VDEIVDSTFPSGQHTVVWEPVTSHGMRTPPGIYFARATFEAEGKRTSKAGGRLILLD